MTIRVSDRVELRRATRGTDLWPAIEAAQYTRIVACDPGLGAAEQAAVTAFVETFGRCAENWDQSADRNKTGFFQCLETQLTALARLRLNAYAGTAERWFETEAGTRSLPIAVLHVGRQTGAVLSVRVPEALSAS